MRARSSRGLQNSSAAVAEVARTLRKQVGKTRRSWMGLYKLCTISWQSLLHEHFRLWMMRNRLFVIPSAILVVGMKTVPGSAQEKIQAFVNPYGKVVFTNLV